MRSGPALSSAQIRKHYETEKRLSDRLRNSTKEERKALYGIVYEELFREIPYHSQLTQKGSPEAGKAYVNKQIVSLNRFLTKNSVFLEIGAGDCALSLAIAPSVKYVYALDVSDSISSHPVYPENFSLRITEGTDIPFEKESIDFAYSHQLMEHLHPEDALDQLKNIHSALSKGGMYFCITPNSAYGPHDISKYFDKKATGFHLKEYTIGELTALMKVSGFSKVKACVGTRSRFILVPAGAWARLEAVLEHFPLSWRRSFLKPFLQNRLIAVK